MQGSILTVKKLLVINCFRQMLREFMEVLQLDRSPLLNNKPEPVLEENLQRPMTNFSLVTHGFGTPAILAGFCGFFFGIAGKIVLQIVVNSHHLTQNFVC